MPRVLLLLFTLGVTIYAVIDAIQTEDERIQHLPKLIWIVLILLAPVGIGAIAWYVTGKQKQIQRRGPHLPSAPRGPDDDPDFLRNL